MASRALGDPSADDRAAVGLWHVDVFSDRAMAGNGVAVVRTVQSLDPDTMLRVAQELRQFETIFVSGVTQQRAEARIFTPEEELGFAGHPVLGAAAVLHGGSGARAPETRWRLRVGGRTIPVTTRPRSEGVAWAEMDQGAADLQPPLAPEAALTFAEALGLAPEHLRTDLPTQVASTGLHYLLLPVTAGLAHSHVSVSDLPQRLAEVGADFVYVLDPDRPEGRTWDNRGTTEDVATGSAAGPTAAYLLEHGLHPPGRPLQVHQGRFVGRPSRIDVRVAGDGSVFVGGLVAPFSSGTISLVIAERASERVAVGAGMMHSVTAPGAVAGAVLAGNSADRTSDEQRLLFCCEFEFEFEFGACPCGEGVPALYRAREDPDLRQVTHRADGA